MSCAGQNTISIYTYMHTKYTPCGTDEQKASLLSFPPPAYAARYKGLQAPGAALPLLLNLQGTLEPEQAGPQAASGQPAKLGPATALPGAGNCAALLTPHSASATAP